MRGDHRRELVVIERGGGSMNAYEVKAVCLRLGIEASVRDYMTVGMRSGGAIYECVGPTRDRWWKPVRMAMGDYGHATRTPAGLAIELRRSHPDIERCHKCEASRPRRIYEEHRRAK